MKTDITEITIFALAFGLVGLVIGIVGDAALTGLLVGWGIGTFLGLHSQIDASER